MATLKSPSKLDGYINSNGNVASFLGSQSGDNVGHQQVQQRAAPQSGWDTVTSGRDRDPHPHTATESAVDAYASRVLSNRSPPETCVEPSLGPYITSILRGSLATSASLDIDVQSEITEYDSLMELLEEHCSLTGDVARGALRSIAVSVQTGIVDPFGEDPVVGSYGASSLGGFSSFGVTGAPDGSSLGALASSASSFGGRAYRSSSMGGEDDAVMLLGQMLEQGNVGLGEVTGVGNGHSPDRHGSGSSSGSGESAEQPLNDNLSAFLLDEDMPALSNGDRQISPSVVPHSPSVAIAVAVDGQEQKQRPTSVNLRRTPGSGREKHANGLGIAAPTSSGFPSLTPLKEDTLIPMDLLGALDDPSTPSRVELGSSEEDKEVVSDGIVVSKDGWNEQSEAATVGPEQFPSITEAASTSNRNHSNSPIPSKKGVRGSKKSKKAAKDLAAALFVSSRSRSNSTIAEKSPMLKPMGAPQRMVDGDAIGRGKGASPDPFLNHQLASAADILLSMNGVLGEDAAYEAALVANADINVAQYVIDGAMSAPPVCRHLLNGGCYRSDCHFSHDVDGHTCLFWLRGRCTKGDQCQFLHGFCEKLLKGMKSDFLPGNAGSSGEHAYTSGGPSYNTGQPQIKTSNLLERNQNAAYSLPKSPFVISSPFSSPSFKSVTPGPQGSDFGSFSLGGEVPSSNSGIKSPPLSANSVSIHTTSFSNVASTGYSTGSSFLSPDAAAFSHKSARNQYVRIPQGLWHANERRDASAFHLVDPMERYEEVSLKVDRPEVIDLHFQSAKTFPIVLETVLDVKLDEHGVKSGGEGVGVWIVTGSGHHVDRSSHQKQGSVLEDSVCAWLDSHAYEFVRGRDRNGHGGAILVKRQRQ